MIYLRLTSTTAHWRAEQHVRSRFRRSASRAISLFLDFSRLSSLPQTSRALFFVLVPFPEWSVPFSISVRLSWDRSVFASPLAGLGFGLAAVGWESNERQPITALCSFSLYCRGSRSDFLAAHAIFFQLSLCCPSKQWQQGPCVNKAKAAEL